MKTLKSKIVLPIAVFMVAIAAAFASQASSAKDLAFEQGYIHTATACELAIECSTTGNKTCKLNGQQVYGMDGSQCIRPLYLPVNPN